MPTGRLLAVYFDRDNRCDLCSKPLLVTDPVRSRCDQCVRYGPPVDIAVPIREFGAKELIAVPCTSCAQDTLDDGTPLPLADGCCLSCRLDGAHRAG